MKDKLTLPEEIAHMINSINQMNANLISQAISEKGAKPISLEQISAWQQILYDNKEIRCATEGLSRYYLEWCMKEGLEHFLKINWISIVGPDCAEIVWQYIGWIYFHEFRLNKKPNKTDKENLISWADEVLYWPQFRKVGGYQIVSFESDYENECVRGFWDGFNSNISGQTFQKILEQVDKDFKFGQLRFKRLPEDLIAPLLDSIVYTIFQIHTNFTNGNINAIPIFSHILSMYRCGLPPVGFDKDNKVIFVSGIDITERHSFTVKNGL